MGTEDAIQRLSEDAKAMVDEWAKRDKVRRRWQEDHERSMFANEALRTFLFTWCEKNPALEPPFDDLAKLAVKMADAMQAALSVPPKQNQTETTQP